MKNLFLILILISVSSATRLNYQTTEVEAMGGTGTASISGANALFLNPAGLGFDSTGYNVQLIGTLGLNPVLIDFGKWALDNSSYMSDIDSLLAKLEPIDAKRAPFSSMLGGNVRIGRFAFSVLGNLEYTVGVAQGPLSPVLIVGANSDTYFMGGYAQEVFKGTRVGGSVQLLHHVKFNERILGVRDDEFYTVKEKFSGDGSSLQKIGAASDVAEKYFSIGSNLGVMQDYKEHWTFGLSILDAPKEPSLNMGASFHGDLGDQKDFHGRYLVNADLRNLFTPDDGIFRKVKTGAAIEGFVNKNPIGYLALGLNDGYPVLGIRAGWWLFFTYTYYTREMGTGAGYQPLTFHKITLDFFL